MNSNPKILVVKMREIIYTLLLLFLVILLIVCLVLMFSPKRRTGQAGQGAQTQEQTSQTQSSQNQTQQTQTSQTQSSQKQAQQAQTSQSQTQQAQTSQAQTTSSQLQATSGTTAARYVPGVYTSPVTLGESAVDVEVTVDENRINSIRLVNLSETVSAAFPLVAPTLEHLTDQILETQKLDGITCPSENKYTAQILFSAISDTVALAQIRD